MNIIQAVINKSYESESCAYIEFYIRVGFSHLKVTLGCQSDRSSH